MQFKFVAFAMIAILAAGAWAQTVVVDGVGPDDGASPFATVSAAAEFFNSGTGKGQVGDNVINITAATITEASGILVSEEDNWTINGNDVVIIADQSASAAASAESAWLGGDDFDTTAALTILAGAATYNVNDLTIIPNYIGAGVNWGDSLVDDSGSSNFAYGVFVDELGASANSPGFTLNIDGVHVAGSAVGNVVTNDPNVNDYPNTTRFDTGFSFQSIGPASGPGVDSGPDNLITVVDTTAMNIGAGDAFGCFADETTFDFNEGIIGAWSGDESITFSGCHNGTATVDGTPAARNLFRGNSQADNDEEGLFTGTIGVTGTDNNFLSLTYTDIVDNGGEGTDFNESAPIVFSNCFIVNNSVVEASENNEGNLRFGMTALIATAEGVTLTWSNLTVYSAGNGSGLNFGWTDTDEIVINGSNIIFATNPEYGIKGRVGADSTINLNDSAIVTAGPDANVLGDIDGANTLTIVQTNITNSDPVFAASGAYVYPPSGSYLRPTAAAYSTAGPAGGWLDGAADGTVPVELSVFSVN